MATVGVPEDVARVERELTAPGGAFATEVVDVGGESMRAFVNRVPHLRAIVEGSVNHGDGEYIVFTDGEHERRITFAEHAALVASVAAALRDEYGVGPGDRVAILAANTPEWILTFWATVSLGAVAVGLNGWSTRPEIHYGLGDCEPRLLVADRKRLARLAGDDAGVAVVEMESTFADLEAYAPAADLPDQPIGEDDPALILYTSGTTGQPKGAINTHRNVGALLGLNFFHGLRRLMVAAPRAADEPPPPPTTMLMTSPLFHVSGLHNGAIAFLLGGVRSVWLTGRFDPASAMRVIERERVTGWSFTETVLHRLVNHPDVDRHDLSTVTQVGGGGSPFAPSLLARTRAVFPNAASSLGIGYGQTECAALATLNFGQEMLDFPDSVGRPLPTVELEIRDPFDEPLPEGQEGEVCVRGPMVMPGYWRRPEESAAVLGPGRWLHTGDIGRMEGGRLYLASRKRDLILRGGENVYPVEIEKRIEDHPDVEECAVLGVDHPELGQTVKAIVVPTPGHEVDTDALAAWVSEALAYFKVPEHWEVRPEPLPRNASGKITKDVLRDPTAVQRFVEE